MLADFRKAFLPTEDEKLVQQELLHKLEQQNINFWLGKGLSDAEVRKLTELEDDELDNLHPYEHWVSRRSMIELGIIDVDRIKRELESI